MARKGRRVTVEGSCAQVLFHDTACSCSNFYTGIYNLKPSVPIIIQGVVGCPYQSCPLLKPSKTEDIVTSVQLREALDMRGGVGGAFERPFEASKCKSYL